VRAEQQEHVESAVKLLGEFPARWEEMLAQLVRVQEEQEQRDVQQAALHGRVRGIEKLRADADKAYAQWQQEHILQTHAALQERLESVERILEESVENHAAWERTRAEQQMAHQSNDEEQLALQHRLDWVEELLNRSADNHTRLEFSNGGGPAELQKEHVAHGVLQAGLQEQVDHL
jgi:hypothetical protein